MDGGLTDGGLDDGNDSDLEAELAALTQGGGAKPKRPQKKKIPDADLDAMVAESMKDIPSDAELSGDDDDPDLLNELSNIAGNCYLFYLDYVIIYNFIITGDTSEKEEEEQSSPAKSPEGSSDVLKLLNDRLKMYEEAEKNAKSAGESGRARRFGRGLKTIKDLIKQANAGRPINNDDIPPEVSTGARKSADSNDSPAPPEPTRSAPPIPLQPEPEPEPELEKTPEEPPPAPQVDPQLINMLTERKNQYKIAALKAKKSGDNTTAISYIKIAKQFETVIAAAQSGQSVDLSRMPGPPQDPSEKLEDNKMQTDSVPQEQESEEPDESLITASSVEEALHQRLDVYKKQEEAAKEQDNASKARRMGRIVKQYEQAIKAHKAGKPISVDELPTPPGYAPIPVPGSQAPKPAPAPPTPASAESDHPKAPPRNKPSTSQTTRISGN